MGYKTIRLLLLKRYSVLWNVNVLVLQSMYESEVLNDMNSNSTQMY